MDSSNAVTGSFSGTQNGTLGGTSGVGYAPSNGLSSSSSLSGSVNLQFPDSGVMVRIASAKHGAVDIADLHHEALATAILAGLYANPGLMGQNGWHGGFDPFVKAHADAYKIKSTLQEILATNRLLETKGPGSELSEQKAA